MSLEDYIVLRHLASGEGGSYSTAFHIPSTLLRYLKSVPIPRHGLFEVDVLKSAKSHPHILTFLESFLDEDTGLCYIALEYQLGGTLAAYNATTCQSIPEGKLWKWIMQLTLALNYLHSMSVLHGNVALGSLFINATDDIVLGEFSRACRVDGAEDWRSVDTLLDDSAEDDKNLRLGQDLIAMGNIFHSLMRHRTEPRGSAQHLGGQRNVYFSEGYSFELTQLVSSLKQGMIPSTDVLIFEWLHHRIRTYLAANRGKYDGLESVRMNVTSEFWSLELERRDLECAIGIKKFVKVLYVVLPIES